MNNRLVKLPVISHFQFARNSHISYFTRIDFHFFVISFLWHFGKATLRFPTRSISLSAFASLASRDNYHGVLAHRYAHLFNHVLKRLKQASSEWEMASDYYVRQITFCTGKTGRLTYSLSSLFSYFFRWPSMLTSPLSGNVTATWLRFEVARRSRSG